MAKKKKNSNYVTEKTENAKVAKEAEARKEQIKKIVKKALPLLLASLALVGVLIGFAFMIGIFDYYPEATEYVYINVEYGDGETASLHVELYGNDAPDTVKHFTELAEQGYFDGMYLHKLLDGCLYGGSVTADGGDKGIKGEFSAAGYENKISHKKGIISMARGEDVNSAYGQFFIVTEDNKDLDGNYAAFAMITEGGMNIIDELIKLADENGDIAPSARPRITSIEAHQHSH